MSDNFDIPVPKNARKDDPFYAQASSHQSQKLMFEPAAELVEIPSHGILYQNDTTDEEVTGKGGIRIRPMTVHEEKILSTPRMVKSGQALDMVFRNTIKSQIDPSKLLSSDRVFLMLWLRNISYGNIYKFKLQCPNSNCKKQFEEEVDLNDLPIVEFTDKEMTEPFEVTLPVSKYKVFFRLPRGVDEIEIVKMQNEFKAVDATDDTIVQRLASVILKIEAPDGQEVPASQKNFFIESLIGRDASTIRNKLEEMDCGVQDIKGISCPYCETQFDTPIPVTENFFRATE